MYIKKNNAKGNIQMKNTQVSSMSFKKLDKLGRLVIPKSIIKNLGLINNQSKLSVFTMDNKIILRKINACHSTSYTNTGLTRKIDSVGRYVIPSEVRKAYGIKEQTTKIGIALDKDDIILTIDNRSDSLAINEVLKIIEIHQESEKSKEAQLSILQLKKNILDAFV